MTAPSTYICRYCRLTSDPTALSCPNCGAPVDVREAVSTSGWVRQPPIADLARIQFGQSRLQIEGVRVPVADFALAADDAIYFSHHVLLWCEPATRLTSMSLSGGWNRMLAGMPLVMLEARGPGRLALSDNHAGDIVALPLPPGWQIWVREHRFLASTDGIRYTWEPSNIWYTTGSGDERETHYPLGVYGDRFIAADRPGLLLLHSPGNTFVRDLAAGETILVQPSALLYRDLSVTMHLHLEYPRVQGVRWWGSYEHRNVWLRLIGPGRVAVQSIFARPETGQRLTNSSPASRASW